MTLGMEAQYATTFRFVTPVWGETHCRLFADVGAPSLMAPNNLPSIAGSSHIFEIYCKDEDREDLRNSASVRQLEATVDVRYERIPSSFEVANHTMMSDCHRKSMINARENGECAVFVPPDCVWSNGTIRELSRILGDDEIRIVHISGLRTDQTQMIPALQQWYREQDHAVLEIDPRNLVRAGLKSLHTIARMHFFNEYEEDLMPANLYWRIDDTALLARCFHLHPLAVRPDKHSDQFQSTIDDDLPLSVKNSRAHYVVSDSDQFVTFEISSPLHEIHCALSKGSIEDVIHWAEYGTNSAHRKLIESNILIHGADVAPETLAMVRHEAGEVVDEVLSRLSSGFVDVGLKYPNQFMSRLYALRIRPPEKPHRPKLAGNQNRIRGMVLFACNRIYWYSKIVMHWGALALFHVQRWLASVVGPQVRRLDQLARRLVFGEKLSRRPFHLDWLYERIVLIPALRRCAALFEQSEIRALILEPDQTMFLTLVDGRISMESLEEEHVPPGAAEQDGDVTPGVDICVVSPAQPVWNNDDKARITARIEIDAPKLIVCCEPVVDWMPSLAKSRESIKTGGIGVLFTTHLLAQVSSNPLARRVIYRQGSFGAAIRLALLPLLMVCLLLVIPVVVVMAQLRPQMIVCIIDQRESSSRHVRKNPSAEQSPCPTI